MHSNPYFPTDLTDEEAKLGFFVTTIHIVSSDSGTLAAVLPINKSAILVKMHDIVTGSHG